MTDLSRRRMLRVAASIIATPTGSTDLVHAATAAEAGDLDLLVKVSAALTGIAEKNPAPTDYDPLKIKLAYFNQSLLSQPRLHDLDCLAIVVGWVVRVGQHVRQLYPNCGFIAGRNDAAALFDVRGVAVHRRPIGYQLNDFEDLGFDAPFPQLRYCRDAEIEDAVQECGLSVRITGRLWEQSHHFDVVHTVVPAKIVFVALSESLGEGDCVFDRHATIAASGGTTSGWSPGMMNVPPLSR